MDGQLNMEAFKDLLNLIMMEQNALVTEKSEVQDTKCLYHRELDASGQVWTNNEMPYTPNLEPWRWIRWTSDNPGDETYRISNSSFDR